MKGLLLPLLAALALPSAVNAKIDSRINERCVDAADYKGCLILNTKIVTLPKCDSYRKNNCIGELRYTNAYYSGEILNGKEHGFGTMNWANRDKYVGQFKNSKQHGQGTYSNSGGDSWSGEWRWGEKTENGSYTKSPEEKAFDDQLKLDLLPQIYHQIFH